MDGFLSELGRRFAERWLSSVLLPGLVFVAVVWSAVRLDHGRPFDLHAVGTAWHDLAAQITRSVADVLLAAAAAFVVAALVGFVVHGVARVTEAVWTGRADRRVAWLSRRVAILDRRLQAQYHGLRVALLWPRLWLLLGDEDRRGVAAARDRIWEAAVQIGWGAAYLALTPWWWPAAIIAATIWVLAAVSADRAALSYVTLVEATVDIHQRTVAEAFGLPLAEGALAPDAVAQLNDRLHK